MRRNLAAAALALLISAGTQLVPAHAASNVGTVAFAGTASLPKFPCPVPPNGDGPCTGTLSGGWHGQATGDVNGGTYHVAWTRPEGLNATFSYYEHQCVEPSTVLGVATGTGYAYAGAGSITGDWQDANGLPRAITEVSAAFTFDWTRLATGALMTFRTIRLDINVNGKGWVRASQSATPALAVFVPLTISEIHQPTCARPVAISGQVAGEVTLTS